MHQFVQSPSKANYSTRNKDGTAARLPFIVHAGIKIPAEMDPNVTINSELLK